MKKIYIAPEMEVVEMKVNQMLTSSLPSSNETPTEWGAPEFIIFTED